MNPASKGNLHGTNVSTVAFYAFQEKSVWECALIGGIKASLISGFRRRKYCYGYLRMLIIQRSQSCHW